MKHTVLLTLAVAWFIPTSSWGADIFWLKLKMVHWYKDLGTDCKGFSSGGDLVLSAEHENGVVKRVLLANHPYTWVYKAIYKSIDLSPRELASIKLFTDKKGRFWLKEVMWEPRTLMWAMQRGAEFDRVCQLPQTLQTISPGPVTLVFETEGLEDGIWVSDSPKHSYSGTRADGQAYQATMQIIQREYKVNH